MTNPQNIPQTQAEIEEQVYQGLMAEIPDLQPMVARGLAITAAARFAKLGIAGLTPETKPNPERDDR